VKTVNAIEKGEYPQTDQSSLHYDQPLKLAPKIFKQDCKINWGDPVQNIYNFIRGLSPYPGAWTELITGTNEKISMKIFKIGKVLVKHSETLGKIETDGKKILRIAAKDGYIDILSLQLAGKKRLDTSEFLRGFQQLNDCKVK